MPGQKLMDARDGHVGQPGEDIGSISFIFAVMIRVYMAAALSPPRSEPAKSHDLRLCRGFHKRNYAYPLIMCSSLMKERISCGCAGR